MQKDTDDIADSWMSQVGAFQIAKQFDGRFPHHEACFVEGLHLLRQKTNIEGTIKWQKVAPPPPQGIGDFQASLLP